ncbi:hypothetical protein AB1Y20_019622 [Prymnesium parvum]|uniref:BSD domain-containing protein n=1 Tax=Prymnesium parvum TaxID=97485 RepID=A0AB34JWF8_PRYPA
MATEEGTRVIEEALHALRLEAAPTQFMDSLRGRISDLGEGCPSLTAVLALTESNEPFLSDDGFASNALFARQWPPSLQLEEVMDAFIQLTTAAHAKDPRLQKRADKLTRKTGEAEFWRRYFGNVYDVLFRMAPTAEEQLFRHLSSLPPPRPPEERVFERASKLRDKGMLPRADILHFLSRCRQIVLDRSTIDTLTRLYTSKGAEWDKECNQTLMSIQLEFMESLGIARAFGISQIFPAALERRFGNQDREVMQAVGMFMGACNNVYQLVAQQHAVTPSADPKKRRYKPAGSLQASGEVDAALLLEIVEGLDAEVNTAESRAKLIESFQKEPPVNGRLLYTRWQREYLESKGVEHEFGMKAVYMIPQRKQKACGAGGEAKEMLEKVEAAFLKMKKMAEAFVESAMIEASRPPEVPVELRRFAPAKGELQTEGDFSREKALEFLTGVKDVLMSEESIKLVAKCPGEGQEFMKHAGMLAITWQREYLEHVGVQQDFGCQALNRVPGRFSKDQEVLLAFQDFQKACMYCVQKARISKEVEEAQRKASEKEARKQIASDGASATEIS